MSEFNLDSLVVFKLMNSEVILCEIVSEDEQQVTVRYAIRAIELFTAEDQEVRFVQWIPFTDDLIILYRHGVLAAAPPSDDMKQMYLNRMAELNTVEDSVTTIEETVPAIRRHCRSKTFSGKK
jgi:hypothetical protein